jgi:chemotaxis methyl-accepting protein methylase
MPQTERACRLVLALTDTDLSPYKEGVLSRRLRGQAREAGFDSVSGYLDALERDGPWAQEQAHRLVAGLCAKVSGFFRDRSVFDELEAVAYPVLLQDRRPGEAVRVWSAACSSGQEAYSLAISLWSCARRLGSGARVTVLGTDLDEETLAQARRGIYSTRAIEGLEMRRRDEAFRPAPGGCWAVRDEVRRLVRFQRGDLLEFSSLPVGFDLVSCRNVLIYLKRSVQEDLILALRRSLVPGGFLVLGSSETVLGRPWRVFEHVSPSRRIYRRPRASLSR